VVGPGVAQAPCSPPPTRSPLPPPQPPRAPEGGWGRRGMASAATGGGPEADTKPFPPPLCLLPPRSVPNPLPPSVFSSSSSSFCSSWAGKPSPALVRRATGRPRLWDLRGGPARGKGRRQRRPHPLCPHPLPARGSSGSCWGRLGIQERSAAPHSPPVRRRFGCVGGEELASVSGVVGVPMGKRAPGSRNARTGGRVMSRCAKRPRV
jgi:hypothetical protein